MKFDFGNFHEISSNHFYFHLDRICLTTTLQEDRQTFLARILLIIYQTETVSNRTE
jgi:hypothetical protein